MQQFFTDWLHKATTNIDGMPLKRVDSTKDYQQRRGTEKAADRRSVRIRHDYVPEATAEDRKVAEMIETAMKIADKLREKSESLSAEQLQQLDLVVQNIEKAKEKIIHTLHGHCFPDKTMEKGRSFFEPAPIGKTISEVANMIESFSNGEPIDFAQLVASTLEAYDYVQYAQYHQQKSAEEHTKNAREKALNRTLTSWRNSVKSLERDSTLLIWQNHADYSPNGTESDRTIRKIYW